MSATTKNRSSTIFRMLRSKYFFRIILLLTYLVTLCIVALNLLNSEIDFIETILASMMASLLFILFLTIDFSSRSKARESELSLLRIERSMVRISNRAHGQRLAQYERLTQVLGEGHAGVLRKISDEFNRNNDAITSADEARIKEFEAILSRQSISLIDLQNSNTKLIRNSMKNLLNESRGILVQDLSSSNNSDNLIESLNDCSFKTLMAFQRFEAELKLMTNSLSDIEANINLDLKND